MDQYDPLDLQPVLDVAAVFQSARVSPAPLQFTAPEHADDGKAHFRFEIPRLTYSGPGEQTGTTDLPTHEQFAVRLVKKNSAGKIQHVHRFDPFSWDDDDTEHTIREDGLDRFITLDHAMSSSQLDAAIDGEDIDSLYWLIEGGYAEGGETPEEFYWSDILPLKSHDIVLKRFWGAGEALKIEYEVVGSPANELRFDIGRSSNGIVVDEYMVDPFEPQFQNEDWLHEQYYDVGTHVWTVTDSQMEGFSSKNVEEDYYLYAIVDRQNNIAELDETNNDQFLEGGTFIDPFAKTLHAHGFQGAEDTLEFTLEPTEITVHFNDTWTFIQSSKVDEIHVRLHVFDDQLTITESSLSGSKPFLVFGGSGNDQIQTGGSDDKLYGGTGDDTYYWDVPSTMTTTVDGGNDVVVELPDGGTDTLDFSSNDVTVAFGNGIKLDLGKTQQQSIFADSPDLLKLTLSAGGGAADSPGTESEVENAIGTADDDDIKGSSKVNLIEGRGGHDKIDGIAQDDELYGDYRDEENVPANPHYGCDTIIGGDGDNDALGGGPMDDVLWSNDIDQPGQQVVNPGGGSGRDVIDGKRDNDPSEPCDPSPALSYFLRGYWPLEDSSYVTVADVVGGNDGNVVGQTGVVTAAQGNGIEFQDAAGKIEISDPTYLPQPSALDVGNGNFSAAIWFKATFSAENSYSEYGTVRLFEKIETDTTSDLKTGYSLSMQNGSLVGEVHALGGATGNEQLSRTASGSAAMDGKWHHAVMTIDGSGALELYFDGKSLATSEPLNATVENDAPLVVGSALIDGDNNGAPAVAKAAVDEVALYGVALTPDEIRQLANHAPEVEGEKNTDSDPDTSATVALTMSFLQPIELNVGWSVAELTGPISDFDSGSIGEPGVAIVGVDDAFADLEVLIASSEQEALTAVFQEIGEVGVNEALLVPVNDFTRFRAVFKQPYLGTIDEFMKVVGWDRTTGEAGQKVDASNRGGNSAFSEGVVTVELATQVRPPVHELTAASDGVQVSRQSTQEVTNFGSSRYASSAFDAAGNYMSVWEGDGPSGYGIYGRLFNADGSRRTATMMLSESGASAYYPSVAMDGNGYSVALWTQYDSYSQPQLFGRAFDPMGLSLGSAFQVSDYAGSTMGVPTIVANDNGQFLAVWNGYNSTDYSTHVYARRLYAGGVSGSQVQVDSGSSTSNYINYYARAAGIDNSGNAVIGWQQYDANWNPQSVVQRLDTFDMPLGSEIVVSYQGSYSGGGPAVAVADDGRFAAAWDVGDGSSAHVFVQVFDAWGNLMGTQQVDDPNYPGINNTAPSLAFDGQQSLGVAWTRDSSTVVANWFDATWGYPVQTEQIVNNVVGAGSISYGPGVAGGENGETFITWQTYDGSTYIKTTSSVGGTKATECPWTTAASWTSSAASLTPARMVTVRPRPLERTTAAT
jgi:hypothetical protein